MGARPGPPARPTGQRSWKGPRSSWRARATTRTARCGWTADLSIRGSTFEQVLVLVDGVRMSDPQTGHFDLDLAVPLERVERIEILRGPASAVYGADALGGVVNVVTRDGSGARSTSAAVIPRCVTALSRVGPNGTTRTHAAANPNRFT